MKNEFAPVTPGEMLKEEFLAEYALSQNQLAKAIGISPNRITEIVNNRRRISEILRCASDSISATARNSG
jgi:addiction module HigA family antidote